MADEEKKSIRLNIVNGFPEFERIRSSRGELEVKITLELNGNQKDVMVRITPKNELSEQADGERKGSTISFWGYCIGFIMFMYSADGGEAKDREYWLYRDYEGFYDYQAKLGWIETSNFLDKQIAVSR